MGGVLACSRPPVEKDVLDGVSLRSCSTQQTIVSAHALKPLRGERNKPRKDQLVKPCRQSMFLDVLTASFAYLYGFASTWITLFKSTRFIHSVDVRSMPPI